MILCSVNAIYKNKIINPGDLQEISDQNLWILAIIGLTTITLAHYVKLNYTLNTSRYIITLYAQRW